MQKKILYLITIIIICFFIACMFSDKTKQPEVVKDPENQNQEISDTLQNKLAHPWLQNRVTFAEIDSIYGNSPAESFRRKYREFKAKFQEGDELWYFCSPPESWGKKHMAGRAGYMIIRKGEVVASIVTLMN